MIATVAYCAEVLLGGPGLETLDSLVSDFAGKFLEHSSFRVLAAAMVVGFSHVPLDARGAVHGTPGVRREIGARVASLRPSLFHGGARCLRPVPGY